MNETILDDNNLKKTPLYSLQLRLLEYSCLVLSLIDFGMDVLKLWFGIDIDIFIISWEYWAVKIIYLVLVLSTILGFRHLIKRYNMKTHSAPLYLPKSVRFLRFILLLSLCYTLENPIQTITFILHYYFFALPYEQFAFVGFDAYFFLLLMINILQSILIGYYLYYTHKIYRKYS